MKTRLILFLLTVVSATASQPVDFARALEYLRPNAQWSCGETYASIVWHDQTQTKPTEAELEAAYEQVLARDARLQQFQTTVEAGYTVQPEGFTLALGDADRVQFTQLLTLIQEALSLGLITNETPQSIADQAGAKHTVTTLRLRQILVGYGLAYKTAWDAARAE